MRLTDTILFQAGLDPERFALVGPGTVVPYGRVAQGLLSAERRLRSAGFVPGDRIFLTVANPLDHIVLSLALHRSRITSVHLDEAVSGDAKITAILTDGPNVSLGIRYPNARMVMLDPTWFQDDDAVLLSERFSSKRESTFTYEVTTAGEITSAELESQIDACLLAAPAEWERLVCLHEPHTAAARRQIFMALTLGRTICFAGPDNARQLASAYRHQFIVGPWADILQLADRQATNFIPIPSLRGLLAEVDQRPAREEILKVIAFVSNTRVVWSDPCLGMIAVSEIGQLLDASKRLGATGPWVETHVTEHGGDNGFEARLVCDADRGSSAWRWVQLPRQLASGAR